LVTSSAPPARRRRVVVLRRVVLARVLVRRVLLRVPVVLPVADSSVISTPFAKRNHVKRRTMTALQS
jgi:hypothetical protein